MNAGKESETYLIKFWQFNLQKTFSLLGLFLYRIFPIKEINTYYFVN